LLSRTRRAIARHPVASFLIIGYGAAVATAAVPPLAQAEVLPFDAPIYASVGSVFGVGLAAFLVTAAADGRPGVLDLLRRSFRWRVPVRWWLFALFSVPLAATLVALSAYGADALESPAGGWPRALAEVLGLFVIQLILFQFAEEVGWTGFLQDRWQDQYSPFRLSAMVAVLWAVWHVPDFFVEEGLGLEQATGSLVFLAYEIVVLFFARVVIVWLYARTGRSVLLVAVWHASFDASISELSRDIVPGSDVARIAILSLVVVLFAALVIVVTRGRFAQPPGSPQAEARA
jgi:membrane protease YdiL (CAAX protease family)